MDKTKLKEHIQTILTSLGYTDINFSALLDFHSVRHNIVATMALASAENVSMWGVARLVGTRVTQFEEKPKVPKTQSHLVNAGIYVMEPTIFGYIKPEAAKLERDVLPRLAEEGKLAGYSFEGLWQDVSTLAVQT